MYLLGTFEIVHNKETLCMFLSLYVCVCSHVQTEIEGERD
jgi:hypothetical protein